MELQQLTITEAKKGLRGKKFSATELTQACLQRIEELEAKIHSFITITAEEALEQAKVADERIALGGDLPSLVGIPLAIKDNICTKGVRTTAGSKILENFTSPYDATVISKLRQQGAVFVGKTNLDEFALGSSTENSAFGPTRNPWDLTRVPGGTSGGSAAAVATGMCLGALGSDTGGSVRQPASFCGVVGLKPTYGAVSRYGLIASTSSLDQIGPLAKTGEDVALIFEAIKGRDLYDATTSEGDVKDVENLRIGLPQEYFSNDLDRGVAGVVKKAIADLESTGAQVIDINLPHTKDALAVYYVVNPSEVSANLARFDGVRYGLRVDGQNYLDEYFKSRSAGFGDEVKRRIMLGTYALSAGYYDAFYLQASKVRRLIVQDFEEAFKKVDVIACPTSPTVAFKFGEKQDPLAMYLADIFTIPANLAGICGINLPCGFSENLPVGLQLLAPRFGEPILFDIASAFETLTNWHQFRPEF